MRAALKAFLMAAEAAHEALGKAIERAREFAEDDERRADSSPDEMFLAPEELALRWQLEPQTLANKRANGEGIPYTKLPSGSVRYRLSDVLEAERDGHHGFTWATLNESLKSFKGLSPNMRAELLRHVKRTTR